jgi:hypothetical protein
MVKRRSNRPLTQFACAELEDLIGCPDGGSPRGSRIEGNTGVHWDITKDSAIFTVSLKSNPILDVCMAGRKVSLVVVNVSDSIGEDGHPSSVIVERLNGLLDALGLGGIIPGGVRVFKDKASDMSYLGRGDDKIAIGGAFSKIVAIKPDPSKFLFADCGAIS